MSVLLDVLDVNADIRIGTGLNNGCLKSNSGNIIIGVCSSAFQFIRDITPFAPALDAVAQLRSVHYFWRAEAFPNKGFGSEQAYGLIAQEVATTLPELVSTDRDGHHAVDYAKLPLLAIQAIKELKQKNDTLAQQLAAIKTTVTELMAARNR